VARQHEPAAPGVVARQRNTATPCATARENEAAAPLDFCLGFHPGILVFVKVKRGRPVLSRHGAWRGNVELSHPALWRDKINPRFCYYDKGY
jgi:hypothetical protein